MTEDRKRVEEFVAMVKEAIAQIEELGRFTHQQTFKGCMLLCLDLFVIYTKLAEPSKLDEVKQLMVDALDAIKKSVLAVTPEQNKRYVDAVQQVEAKQGDGLAKQLERLLLGDLESMMNSAEGFKSE